MKIILEKFQEITHIQFEFSSRMKKEKEVFTFSRAGQNSNEDFRKILIESGLPIDIANDLNFKGNSFEIESDEKINELFIKLKDVNKPSYS